MELARLLRVGGGLAGINSAGILGRSGGIVSAGHWLVMMLGKKGGESSWIFGLMLFLAHDTSLVASEGAAGHWYRKGVEALERNQMIALDSAANAVSRAKSIILFVGDGMGVSTVTAARILEGQRRGQTGEEGLLFFESFPYLALSKTYNTDLQTPDSAGSMTAMMTGEKTRAGVIAVNERARRGDCASLEGNGLITALELAEIAGMSTGVVTTSRLTHATPAAAYAHTVERGHEYDGAVASLEDRRLCTDIARQLVEFPERFTARYPQVDGLEVAMGGGRHNFLGREGSADPETGKPGRRLDGRNLPREWRQRYPNARYVWNAEQLAAVNSEKTDHLLGLFQPSHMQFESKRADDTGGEPGLSAMTKKAIEILSRNPNGYFLVVEGARIDHAHHRMDAANALGETIALAEAVRTAYELTESGETLILVTADHSHVLTIGGYPVRGNPILGKIVSRGKNGLVTESGHTLKYAAKEQAGRLRETHGAEDVAIYATGPGAALVNGTLEQHVIYHIMNRAASLEQRARRKGWPGRP